MRFLVILCMSSHLAFSQVIFKVYKDSVQVLELKDGDEFSGKSLDEDRWHKGLVWTRVLLSQDLAFPPDDIQVDKGLVCFVANKKDSVYKLLPHEIDSIEITKRNLLDSMPYFTAKYSAGCIVSKQKYHYGTYLLKFRVQSGKGIWPAFWFYGGKENEEIDVFEFKGERPNQVHVDVHCPGDCERGYRNYFGFKTNWSAWLKLRNSIMNRFAVAMLEWTPTDLTWFFDGIPVAYYKGSFENPMNIYLNTSVAKTGGPFSPGPDETTKWPNHFEVDFLRIFRLAAQTDTVKITGKVDSRPLTDKIPVIRKRRPYMHVKNSSSSALGIIQIDRVGDSLYVSAQGKVDNVRFFTFERSYENEALKAGIPVVAGDLFSMEIIVGKSKHRKTLRIAS